MNLLLLDDADFAGESPAGLRTVRVAGRRLIHTRRILRARVGDELVVGEREGQIGRGTITRLDRDCLELEVTLDREPPPKLPFTLVLALPRPPVLRRTLAAVTSLGVERIVLLGTRRVEKTFWDASAISAESLDEAIALGLEQAVDTRRPQLLLRRYFKPFAEDELPALARGAFACFAHPTASQPCPAGFSGPTLVALGPEGGLLPFEVAQLERAGLEGISLGERILRVETAAVAVVSRALPGRGER